MKLRLLFLLNLLLNPLCVSATPLGTAFTYQGRLSDGGAPASGIYDLRFTIYDSTNNAGGIVASPLTNSAVAVSNGLFTTTLDFGEGVFDAADRWLEIGVRTNGSVGAFTALSPRQPLTPAPYALYAPNAGAAKTATTALTANGVSAANILGTIPDARLSANVALLGGNAAFAGAVTAMTFNGSGAGLTNVPAAALSGTIADAQLSANIPRLNVATTAVQATGSPIVTAGFITGATVTSGGTGYVTAPTVTVNDSTGSNAVLAADISAGGIVTNLTVQNAGSGYSADATLAIDPPPSNAYQVFAGSNYFSGVNLLTNVNNVVAGNFSGNGGGLVNLDASALAGTVPDARLSSNVALLNGNAAFAGSLTASVFNGSGAGLSNVPSGSLTGTIADSQLSANIARLNANQTFTGTVTAGGFVGSGAGLTNLPVSSVGPTTNSLIVGWGDNGVGQATAPAGVSNVVAVGAGELHSLALKNDGTVVTWGYNGNGQTTVPAGLNNVVAVAAGRYHNLALKNDGTVVGWGGNGSGEATVPAGLSNVVAVAAGSFHSLALKGNGTIVAWGYNGDGETNVPAGLTNVTAMGSGGFHSLAVKNDGTVVAWGQNLYGGATVPAGLSNVTAVAAGFYHSLALKNDGTVVAWGYNGSGATNVPPGLNNVAAVAAGRYHSLALKNDGTVVAWGSSYSTVPAGLTNIIAIGPGCAANHVLAIQRQHIISPATLVDGTLPGARLPDNVALLNANQTFTGQNTFAAQNTFSGEVTASGGLRLNDANLWLRSGSDRNSGLGWFGTGKLFNGVSVDGPVLFGQLGGALGATLVGAYTNIALVWKANGNVGIGTANPTNRLMVVNARCDGNSWINSSDRNLKENFRPVDTKAILAKVAALPITKWNYKSDPSSEHLGPVAQDFHANFGLGSDCTSIATVDASGVALAAIQGLNQKLMEELKRRDAENAALKERLEKLERWLNQQLNGGAQ